nr:transposase [Octadecabacter antarcticus]
MAICGPPFPNYRGGPLQRGRLTVLGVWLWNFCSNSPVPASSGKTIRHRLNRGGDRAANSALHIIAIGRLRLDPKTQEYFARRVAQGHSKLEAIRCLKRYIAREAFDIIARRHKQINQTQIAA